MIVIWNFFLKRKEEILIVSFFIMYVCAFSKIQPFFNLNYSLNDFWLNLLLNNNLFTLLHYLGNHLLLLDFLGYHLLLFLPRILQSFKTKNRLIDSFNNLILCIINNFFCYLYLLFQIFNSISELIKHNFLFSFKLWILIFEFLKEFL